MKTSVLALSALCAFALAACTTDEGGLRRPPVRGTSDTNDPAGSRWDNAPQAGDSGRGDTPPPFDPMRPRAVTHGDPEPLELRPPLRRTIASPSDLSPSGGELPVPPPMDSAGVGRGGTSLPGTGLALPPPPPPTSPPPATPPAGEHSGLAPLLPGAKAPGASADDPLYYSFLGKELPDLASDGVWLTPGVSPTISGLRGQVVYLQFAFQSCPSCGLTTPFLQQWQQSFGPPGLSIVYVNNGLMANKQAAEKAIVEQKLLFPYLHDPAGESLRIYGVRAFPTAYVTDRSGKVVWEGTPTANEPRIGELIQSLLLAK